jgi:hypothetical protein
MNRRILFLTTILFLFSLTVSAQSRSRAIRNPSRTSSAQAAYGTTGGQSYKPKKKKKTKSKKIKMKKRTRDSGKSGMNLLYRKD